MSMKILRGMFVSTTWLFLIDKREFQRTWLLSQAEIARQEARLKMEKENLEKEKSVLMGTASNPDNQDGALEITVSGEKYRCLRFAKAKKWGLLNENDGRKVAILHEFFIPCLVNLTAYSFWMLLCTCRIPHGTENCLWPLLILFDVKKEGFWCGKKII